MREKIEDKRKSQLLNFHTKTLPNYYHRIIINSSRGES